MGRFSQRAVQPHRACCWRVLRRAGRRRALRRIRIAARCASGLFGVLPARFATRSLPVLYFMVLNYGAPACLPFSSRVGRRMGSLFRLTTRSSHG